MGWGQFSRGSWLYARSEQLEVDPVRGNAEARQTRAKCRRKGLGPAHVEIRRERQTQRAQHDLVEVAAEVIVRPWQVTSARSAVDDPAHGLGQFVQQRID